MATSHEFDAHVDSYFAGYAGYAGHDMCDGKPFPVYHSGSDCGSDCGSLDASIYFAEQACSALMDQVRELDQVRDELEIRSFRESEFRHAGAVSALRGLMDVLMVRLSSDDVRGDYFFGLDEALGVVKSQLDSLSVMSGIPSGVSV